MLTKREEITSIAEIKRLTHACRNNEAGNRIADMYMKIVINVAV